MNFVFDSSALVKRLILEDGIETARDLWEQADRRVVSALAYLESCSALALATRQGRIGLAEAGRAQKELAILWGISTVVDVTQPIAEAAGELVMATGLKGADAVHLATALSVGLESTVLVTWDKALSHAAQEHGLAVAP